MTPAEIAAALIAAGHPVDGFADLGGGLVRLMLRAPSGLGFAVEVPTLASLEATVANAETVIRFGLTPFETDVGRGFNSEGRGALVLQRGYRAGDGWV